MSDLKTFQMYIGGQFVDPADGEWFDSFNPYTGKPWARIPHGTAEDVERVARRAG